LTVERAAEIQGCEHPARSPPTPWSSKGGTRLQPRSTPTSESWPSRSSHCWCFSRSRRWKHYCP